MEEYTVDLSGVTDREGLHRRLRESLPLPSWYGDNLDALYDAVTEFYTPACISITGWAEIQEAMPRYFNRFRLVLRDAQEETPGLEIFFE